MLAWSITHLKAIRIVIASIITNCRFPCNRLALLMRFQSWTNLIRINRKLCLFNSSIKMIFKTLISRWWLRCFMKVKLIISRRTRPFRIISKSLKWFATTWTCRTLRRMNIECSLHLVNPIATLIWHPYKR